MAAKLRTVSTTVSPALTTTRATWRGDASDAFHGWWADIDGGIGGAADMFDEVATNLDEIAAEIERINDEIQTLYAAIVATVAVSIAASFITFGASAAAGAALATRNAAIAGNLVRNLHTFFRGIRVSFTAFRLTRFAGFWRTWAIAAGTNTAVTGAFKFVMEGQNPFDRESWTRQDVTGIIVGSTLGAGVATAVPAAAAHPFLTGFGTGATGSVISDVWVKGMPLDRNTFRNALLNGTLSGAGGVVSNRIITRLGGPPPRTTGDLDLDPPELIVAGRPTPGDPSTLIDPTARIPGDPTTLIDPTTPTPGDPSRLIVAGRPTPGDPTTLIDPTTPIPGDPSRLIVVGRPPAPIEGPVRIYLPGDPAPRPIIAGPPVVPRDWQKQRVKAPIDLLTRIGKDPFLVEPRPITPSGGVTTPVYGPWPAPPPADRVLVGAP